MSIGFSFIAKSMPAILVLGGIMFMLLDQTAKTTFGIAGPTLIVLGIIVSLFWAGFFRRLF